MVGGMAEFTVLGEIMVVEDRGCDERTERCHYIATEHDG